MGDSYVRNAIVSVAIVIFILIVLLVTGLLPALIREINKLI